MGKVVFPLGWQRVLLATAAATLTACTALVSLDGLAGDATAGMDAMGVDATSDGPDARPDDAGRPACPSTAFCDDFDDGRIAAWWTEVVAIGGTATVVAGGQSPPNTLRSYVPPLPPGDGGDAERGGVLTKRFGARTSLHCSFALWVQTANADTDIVSFSWKTESGKAFYTWLDSYTTSTSLGRAFVPSGPFLDGVTLPLLPRRRWIAIDIQTDFTAIELRVDGQVVHRAQLGNGTTPRATDVAMTLGGRANDRGENEFLYDDVRCE